MVHEGVLALCWSPSADRHAEAFFFFSLPSSSLLRCLIQIQRACLKRGWAVVKFFRVCVLGREGAGVPGVNMTDGITREPSQRFRRAWNRAGFSCIPVHLPTCSLWWLQWLRCTVSTLCLPVWWDLTAPQSCTDQSESKRGGQSNCKRPSYINGAKVLCFIWTCLGLFVCTPHSFILGEMQGTVFPPTLNTYTMQLVDAEL